MSVFVLDKHKGWRKGRINFALGASMALAATLFITRITFAQTTLTVDPTGSDTNDCVTAPCATIGRALALAWSGAVIFINSGTYRESLTVVRPVTLNGKLGTILDGSVPVTGWVRTLDGWDHAGWTVQLVPTSDVRGIDPGHPLAKYSDAVFEDGKPLTNACAPDGAFVAPAPGEFCINYAAHTLTIGDNPTGHDIAAIRFPTAVNFNPSSAGSTLQGLTVTRYAPHYDGDQCGAILVSAYNVTLDHVSATWNSNRAVFARNVSGLRITGGDYEWNREGGLAGYQLNDALIQGNTVSNNNWNHDFLVSWDASGMKFARGSKVTVKGNTLDANYGPGIWYDFAWSDATVVNNTVRHSAHHCIQMEKGGPGIVADNLVSDCHGPVAGSAGISIAGSSNIKVWNNTIIHAFTAIKIVDSIASGIPLSTGNAVVNNLLADGFSGDLDLYYVHNYSSSSGNAAPLMVSASDFNVYWQNGAMPPSIVGWDRRPGEPIHYPTLSAFAAANPPYDVHSLQAAAMPYDPATFHSLYDTGAPLPAGIAGVLGLAAGAQVGIGQFGAASPIPSPISTPIPTPSLTPTPTSTPTPTTTPIPTPKPTSTPMAQPSPTPTPSGDNSHDGQQ